MSSASTAAKKSMRPISAAFEFAQSKYIKRPPIRAARVRYAMLHSTGDTYSCLWCGLTVLVTV